MPARTHDRADLPSNHNPVPAARALGAGPHRALQAVVRPD